MRSFNYVTFFAGAVLAQESTTVINFFQFDSTLTVVGSDAKATTFKNSCPSNSAGVSAIPSSLHDASPSPAPTAKPRMRRQIDDGDNYSFCEPYTIVQGSETYEMHLTDPVPGAWTVDMKCNWKGEMTKADLTCDVTQNGWAAASSDRTTTTSMLSQSEIQDMELLQVVALVSATGATGASSPASASAKPTPTPTGSAANAPSKSGSDAAPTASKGLAAAGPLPTGAMKVVGGAVGALAIAIAL